MPGTRGFLERLQRNTTRRSERVADLLKKARTELKLTQPQVGEILGWHQSDVSKMETGDRTPTVVELENFALMCGKQLDYFATCKAQFEAEGSKKSLAIPPEKFFRRRRAAERQAAFRRRFGKRRTKRPPPTGPGKLTDAYNEFLAQQEIKRLQRLARMRKFPPKDA